MKTLCFSRRTIGVAGLAALAFVVACSDDSTTSSTPDAASKVDATPGASDSSTPDAGGCDATAASDSQSVSEASTTDDSSSASTDGGPTADASDGGGSTDGGSSADGTIGDAGAMVDSAGDVVTAADVTTADVVGDAGSASNDATMASDVTSDVTTDDGSSTADAATDALGDASASPDSAAIVDGATDAGDAVAGALYTYTFDTSTEAWGNYGAFPFVGDAGLTTPVQQNSTVTWSGTFGEPAGSLKVYAAFDDAGERLRVATGFYPGPDVDLTGTTMSMDLFLAGGSQLYSYLYVYAQDINDNWMDNAAVPFPAVPNGTWFTASIPFSSPKGYVSPGFDTTRVRTVGVEIDSGGGAGAGTITPVTVYIDNVVIQ